MNGGIVVTGATGFVGRTLCRAASSSGRKVTGIGTTARENAGLPDGVEYLPVRLPDSSFTRLIDTTRPDILFHCAGRSSVPMSVTDPRADFLDGPALTFEVLETVRRASPRTRIVFLSSAAVYGEPKALPVGEHHDPGPLSPYGFHKLASELLCKEFAGVYGLSIVVTRIFSAYGPGLRRQVVWEICRQIADRGEVVLKGTGGETRDFLHVTDLARALLLVGECGMPGIGIFNVASGVEVSIQTVAERLIALSGTRAELRFDGELRRGDPLHWRADVSQLSSLGFAPTIGLDGGLRGVVRWAMEDLGVS